MIESGRDDLSKGGTLRASEVSSYADIHPHLTRIDTKNVAEFVNNSALLCCHQQHQKA
jgi:hypothetical protein